MAVHFYEENITSGLKQKRKLAEFLTGTAFHFLQECKKVQLNYIFCTDASLFEKNVHYLNHDTFTDVITFDLSENAAVLQAEIYISIERIRENAKKFEVPYQEELHRVIFHGLLHLCGFKDKTPDDQKEMRLQEQNCLQQYFAKA